MPLREIVTPWGQQPQEWADVDWGNPITQGLEWYWTPIDSGPIVFNKPSNPVSAVCGVAQKFRSSVADNIQGDRATPTPTAQGTVFALMISGPGTAAAGVVCRASGVGALGIRTGTGLVYAIAAAQSVGPSISLGANTLAFVAARNNPGNTGTIYCNGVFASAALTISSPSSAPAIGFTASGQNADHTVFLAGSFSRALSDAEIASLGANPWQLFVRRDWVLSNVAAGGGGVTGASSGTLELAGTAAGSVLVSGASAGTLAISGGSAAEVRVTGASTGALSLSGTATGTVGATGVTGQSSQTLSLTGTSTGTVGISGQSAQTLALSGTAAGSVRVSGASAGTLSITGTATGNTTGAVTGASAGVLSLSGAATGTVRVSGGSAAVLQITGNAGAQIVVRGVSAGVLLMTGGATANNGEPEPLAIRASLSSRTRIRTDGAGTRPAQRSTASRPRQ